MNSKTAYLLGAEARDTDLNDLAALFLKGVRRVVVPEESDLHDCIVDLNALLTSRELPAIKVVDVDAKAIASLDHVKNEGRRGLMTRMSAPLSKEETPETPLTTLLSFAAETPGALFPIVPVIDANACTGCDACMNACPDEALITLKDEGGALWYVSDARKCTVCELCVDMCSDNAIFLEKMRVAVGDVLLHEMTCRACGVPYHEPVIRGQGDGLCRICHRTGHHRKLFQVVT